MQPGRGLHSRLFLYVIIHHGAWMSWHGWGAPFVQGHLDPSPSHLWLSLSSLSKRLQSHPSLEMLSLHWLTPTSHKGLVGWSWCESSRFNYCPCIAKESHCKDKPWGWSHCEHKTSQRELSLGPLLGAGDQHCLQEIIHCHLEWGNV